jgi:ubiquinone/menaquinone biosynthesis C-methylase UbiE
MPFWEIYSYFYSLSLGNSFPYRRLLEDLINTLQTKEGDRILDAGCGPGLLMGRIIEENKERRINITGLDFNKRMIKHAQRRCKDFPNVKLEVADLNRSLAFPDNSFDKVICSNTLYALEDPRKVISEFHRVLKRGGTAIIANPKPNAGENALIREHIRALNRLTPFGRRIYHIIVSILLIPVNLAVITINRVIVEKGRSGQYHFLAKEDLQNILQAVGFKNIDVSSCYADQDWLVRAEK